MRTGFVEQSGLLSLSPRDVAGWLRMRGFLHIGSVGEYGALFRRTKHDNEQELLLPTSPSTRDFVIRMRQLIEDLSEYEERRSNEVMTDLYMAPFDVVKVRSPDADDYGSIRFSAGIDLHAESKNLLRAAANAAASNIPRRSWRGRSFDEVNDYLGNVRLGQTQIGSFVLNVLSPWDFSSGNQVSLDLSEPSFGRRVTNSLAAALSATERALRKSVVQGAQPIVDSYKSGISSNFCAALARLAAEGDGVDVGLAWSPSAPKDKVVNLSLRREDAAVLTEASVLLASQEAEPNFTIEGLVTLISDPSQKSEGSVIVETVLAGALRKVRMKFTPGDRALIYEAAEGRKWISVQGDLQRQGQRLILENARDIAIITPQETDLDLIS
ncbi:hypothetical protein [uncultured Agrobacterium sp.]|uniref:hypothetical protein n=1 Tax=uncultured Agrobacterium sp. TaxID=157277 RepID=UPI0025FCDF7A|nr:hypothetical protein [uncultured Agrobacterium sp.]